MTDHRRWTRLRLYALAAMAAGGIGCIIGAIIDPAAFFPAWLSAFIFWLGMPLGALTLILVHDLTGGRWMATARPELEAAVATMPLATIAFLPLLAGLGHLYEWSRPGQGAALGNAFYLNNSFFILRYAVCFVIWNVFAFYALWAPRSDPRGVVPGISWASGVGLLLLAYSVTFASIDWIMSTEPNFWSSVFGMFVGAGEFVASLALVLVIIALRGPLLLPLEEFRDHLADLAAILLATIMFWAYAEYCQFLIVWEENLRSEITWYVRRMDGAWEAVMYTIAAVNFLIPFLVLLWRPAKRSRAVVFAVAVLVVLAHQVDVWWLILPEFPESGFGWLDVAATFALGGLWLFLFLWRLQSRRLLPERMAHPVERAING